MTIANSNDNSTANVPKWAKINFLVSHHFMRGNEHYRELAIALSHYANLMVDSGAFSAIHAVKKGQKSIVNLTEYIDACQRYYHPNAWQYVMLDVIGNKRRTQINLDTMYDAGLTPMPVFVEGESPEHALHLVEKYNPRICVAGGASGGDAYIHRRFQTVWRESNHKALIHGLGFLRWPNVYQLPIATGDSSTSSSGARFGHITMYERSEGPIRLHWREVMNPDNKSERAKRILSFMRQCGVTHKQLFDEQSYRTSTGIPTLFELYATLQFMEHSNHQKFGLFSAFATASWLTTFISVIAVSKRNSFDYNEAIVYFNEFKHLFKTDYKKAIDLACNIVKEHTHWQTQDIVIDDAQTKALQIKFKDIRKK